MGVPLILIKNKNGPKMLPQEIPLVTSSLIEYLFFVSTLSIHSFKYSVIRVNVYIEIPYFFNLMIIIVMQIIKLYSYEKKRQIKRHKGRLIFLRTDKKGIVEGMLENDVKRVHCVSL